MNRRELLVSFGAGTIAAVAGRRLRADTPKDAPAIKSYVYKRTTGCDLQADVREPAGGGSSRPVLVYLHGGALIMGSRADRPGFEDALLQKGCVVVSLDYRLAPETKLPGIIDDLRDGLRWVREKGPALFKADPDRVAVHGVSAGGYLTLMAGFGIEPRPRALVSYFGYGDIISDWLVRPDPGYSRQPKVSREQALSTVGRGVPPCGDVAKDRFPFYLYCRQTGRWPVEVAGVDPHADANTFTPYCPVRNVTADYPPTLLCHGTKDADVPYEQSRDMALELTRAGVANEFIPVRNADHGFGGASAKVRDLIRRRTLSFLDDYLG